MRFPVTAKMALATAGAIGGRAGFAQAPPFVAAGENEMGFDHRRVGHAGDRIAIVRARSNRRERRTNSRELREAQDLEAPGLTPHDGAEDSE
jgi:hypothetical protein